jgi:catechol 2,3-dioxygenase-like lactoylglutathione lyase family enzyme
MNHESAVQFETNSRIRMGLAVKNLERSVAFYRTLFGQEPTKTRPRYAKFEVAEPPVNLALNEVGGATGPNNPVAHFGIQVKTSQAVKEVADLLAAAGRETRAEENVTCCYAVQNKVWATDPDGNKWEVYVVLDNDSAHHHPSQDACCPEMATIKDAVQRGDLSAARSAIDQAPGKSACCAPANDAK